MKSVLQIKITILHHLQLDCKLIKVELDRIHAKTCRIDFLFKIKIASKLVIEFKISTIEYDRPKKWMCVDWAILPGKVVFLCEESGHHMVNGQYHLLHGFI